MLPVNQYQFSNGNNDKLLGVTIDNKLRFTEHVVGGLVKRLVKTSCSRKSLYEDYEYGETSYIKAFIISQVGYCPLV